MNSPPSIWILIVSIIILFVVVHVCYRYSKNEVHPRTTTVEAFSSGTFNNELLKSSQNVDLHETTEIYDDFYSEVYNTLFLSNMKNNWECMWIYKQYMEKWKSKHPLLILDVGCGTGHHMKIFSEYFKLPIDGMDQSTWMLKKAKITSPESELYHHNFEISSIFKKPKYTHILCLFYTIYYSKNLKRVFTNFYSWLHEGGYAFVHVVRRDRFDPILERSSSLIPLYDPQKHSKKRMTHTTLHFKEFTYDADWVFEGKRADFKEKFAYKIEPFIRTQTHHFILWDISEIKKTAQSVGFKMVKAFDLAMSGMDYNYIMVFQKM